MLETKNLTKTYKPKKGVPVKALDGISLKLPDRGMVFLLGKSGSGKSTLLNLLGGLDKYDGGEILIKGVSSKDFSQSHFDSYRNTYVGFIFQEYNILEEFSVGANIALAMELQGKKATDEGLCEILSEVDLAGYGQRKPGELSGGQKQRVAIARALVKNPQIIMADEPTGALDSATGKQVFDTLKKLSREKLVIVVSHDREFAEKYADRIVELADGKVISDIEYFEDGEGECERESLKFEGERISVPAGYHLTEEDREAINRYIDELKSGAKIDLSKSTKKRKSRDVDNSLVSHSTGAFELIKSKLPLKNAFKIGASGLGHKKIRLVITILLSCIAFGLFGLADTFGAYNHVNTCTSSIVDTGITYASVERAVRLGYVDEDYFSSYETYISDEDLATIKDATGVDMRGVFVPRNAWHDMVFTDRYSPDAVLTETEYSVYSEYFSGYVDIDDAFLKEMGYTVLAGALPDGSENEMAISEYVAETFLKAGYIAPESDVVQKISGYSDMVGKVFIVNGNEYTVTAVIDTGFDFDRYIGLTKSDATKSTAENLVDYALFNELRYIKDYSLAQAVMVGRGHVEKITENVPTTKTLSYGYFSFAQEDNRNDYYIGFMPDKVGTLKDVPAESIIWTEGEKTSLSDGEIIVSSDLIDSMYYYEIYENGADYGELIASSGSFVMKSYLYGDDVGESAHGSVKIVGYMNSDENPALRYTVILSEKNADTPAADQNGGIYSYAIGPMPESRADIRRFVEFAYDDSGNVKYPILNSVTYELDTVNVVLKSLSKWFLYIGIGFAIFAAVMLANFISTSISYKKQEIGILRAIGSRSNDVFRIFFSESFIIAAVNFILSAAGVAVAVALINYLLRTRAGIFITVLSFGIRQIVLLFAVSLITAAIASFVPVKKIASKRPIDAIRNR